MGGLSFCEWNTKSRVSDNDLNKSQSQHSPFALFLNNSKDVEIHFFTPEWANKNGDKERKKFNKLIKNYLLTF